MDPYPREGAPYPVYESLDACDVEADVIIDFSNAAAVDALLAYSIRRQIPAVVCTTGLSEEQKTHIYAAFSASRRFRGISKTAYRPC